MFYSLFIFQFNDHLKANWEASCFNKRIDKSILYSIKSIREITNDWCIFQDL